MHPRGFYRIWDIIVEVITAYNLLLTIPRQLISHTILIYNKGRESDAIYKRLSAHFVCSTCSSRSRREWWSGANNGGFLKKIHVKYNAMSSPFMRLFLGRWTDNVRPVTLIDEHFATLWNMKRGQSWWGEGGLCIYHTYIFITILICREELMQKQKCFLSKQKYIFWLFLVDKTE